MKRAILAGLLLGVYSTATASPLADILIGAVMVANGGVFYALQDKESKDRDDNEKKATEKVIAAIEADESSFYYQGAADWEFINFGNTSIYRSFSNTASSYRTLAFNRAVEADVAGSAASDHRNKENVYKGVSLTSFGVGGVFIVKGIIGYAINKSDTARLRKYEWARNFDIMPNQTLDGANVTYKYKFDL